MTSVIWPKHMRLFSETGEFYVELSIPQHWWLVEAKGRPSVEFCWLLVHPFLMSVTDEGPLPPSGANPSGKGRAKGVALLLFMWVYTPHSFFLIGKLGTNSYEHWVLAAKLALFTAAVMVPWCQLSCFNLPGSATVLHPPWMIHFHAYRHRKWTDASSQHSSVITKIIVCS